MKKIYIFILSLIIICCSSSLVLAHSGRTDTNGGHFNRDTGDYHYHHGLPEHDHPDGVCPYESNNEESSSNTTTETETSESPSNFVKFLGCVVGGLFLGYIFGLIPTSVFFLLFLIFTSKETQGKYSDILFKICTIVSTSICSVIVFIGLWKDLF